MPSILSPGELAVKHAVHTINQSARSAEKSSAGVHGYPKGPSPVAQCEPTQVGLTKEHDGLIIMFANAKPTIVPVRKLRRRAEYVIVELPEELWDIYCKFRSQCNRLGFHAVKQPEEWVLHWKPIGG